MIILMGVAGAGKSMQGNLLAERYGYQWLSTGEYLRASISGERKAEMLAGKLLDDQEIIDLLSGMFEEIKDPEKTILDGFPRTLVQAKWLLDEHKAGRLVIDRVLFLNAPIDVVKDRLLGRGRQDDTEEALEKRFQDYKELTFPIIEWLANNGIKVDELDASPDPEHVHQTIIDTLGIK